LGWISFCLFSFFFCGFLGTLYHSRDRPGPRAKRSLQRAAFARTADGKRTVCSRHDLARSHANNEHINKASRRSQRGFAPMLYLRHAMITRPEMADTLRTLVSGPTPIPPEFAWKTPKLSRAGMPVKGKTSSALAGRLEDERGRAPSIHLPAPWEGSYDQFGCNEATNRNGFLAPARRRFLSFFGWGLEERPRVTTDDRRVVCVPAFRGGRRALCPACGPTAPNPRAP